MRRREIIALAGGMYVVRSGPAIAQQAAMPVVGFLGSTSPQASTQFFLAFRDGLKESGYVEGRNVVIEERWAEGRHEQLPTLVAELVALNVAVIVAPTGPSAMVARKVTQTIPIAFMSGDPVARGLVSSLSRPGGNATGVNILALELTPKRLELLRDLVPSAKSVAVLVSPAGFSTPYQLSDLQVAARMTGHDLQVVEVRTDNEIEQAFARLADRRPGALLVTSDALFLSQRDRIIALAAQWSIPAIYDWPEFALAGGLISYGTNLKDALRLLGVYTGRILAGARPADLPVQQPTAFELVINLKTAKALGLTIPPAVLARADEVIE
jgi:putative ABC transport system substrate-binding protein